MALFVIADTHLSLSVDKPMDIFGGWHNYMERLEQNWRALVSEEDTVVIPGDVSWGMSLEQARADFAFLDRLPGKQKILLKGNHDYWWTTRAKMERFLEQEGFFTLRILNNDSVRAEGVSLCGTRGWLFEQGQPHDQKIVSRETGRLRASLEHARQQDLALGEETEKIVFLHYPPLFLDQKIPQFLEVMTEYGVRRCYYGHIHSAGCQYAFNGSWGGIQFTLVSGDFLKFIPKKIK